MSPSIGRTGTLTPGERAALSIAATGLGVADVAEAMGVPPERVHEWLTSAVERLGARSKLEAVLIAGRTGQLDLSR